MTRGSSFVNGNDLQDCHFNKARKIVQDDLKVGGIYSVENDNGRFGVVKILALEPSIVHIRIYTNSFATRPERIDPSTLYLGSILDDDEFGIGHVPLSRNGFVQ